MKDTIAGFALIWIAAVYAVAKALFYKLKRRWGENPPKLWGRR